MTTLYWFALVVGGGLLLVSMVGHVLGDLFGDGGGGDAGGGGGDVAGDGDAGGADADATGADADSGLAGGHLDASGHMDAGGHGAASHGHGDQQGFRILSLRTATYFLFGLGAAGVLLTWAWRGAHPLVAGAVALLTGVLTAWLSATLFGWVGRGSAGELAGDRALVGATGVVTLPLSAGRTGKVLVRSAGRELELLARPVARDDAGDPAAWTDVMVVDIEDGVAVVASYDVPER